MSNGDKLTALGFVQSYPREYLQQFGQHGTEYGIASSMLMNLWLLDDGTIIALGRWCEDMHVDEFVNWWQLNLERKQKPVERQKELF